MNACEWSQNSRYVVRKCWKWVLSFYEVNQYHTKSSISVFLLEKSTWLKCDSTLLQRFNKQWFNYNYKMLQNNVIFEWIIAYKEPCAKRDLSCHFRTFFSIKGSLELSKEPYASYRTPMNPFFLYWKTSSGYFTATEQVSCANVTIPTIKPDTFNFVHSDLTLFE